MYVSKALNNATTQEQCVTIINAGVCEGMEGIELTSEQLAGQYAAYAAIENGYTTDQDLVGQLDCIEEAGATFERTAALEHAKAVRDAALADRDTNP